MSRPLVKIGDPVLREKARELEPAHAVQAEIRELIDEMVKTMREAEGVGLAANQIGVPLHVLVLECRGSARYPGKPKIGLEVYLNARILEARGRSEDWEGCLSIPGYRGLVPRAEEIVIEALLPDGTPVRRRAEGFLARILQHEIDHLSGLFYADRMPDLCHWMHLDEFNRRAKTAISEGSAGL